MSAKKRPLPDHKIDGTITQANLAAQGDPLASGERTAGSTLTADTGGITDHNGLTDPMFTYQWQRVDSGTPEDITGATEETYTLTDDDVDKRIQLHVEFTDDGGSAETLTGPATSRIVRAPRGLINSTSILEAVGLRQLRNIRAALRRERIRTAT